MNKKKAVKPEPRCDFILPDGMRCLTPWEYSETVPIVGTGNQHRRQVRCRAHRRAQQSTKEKTC